MNSTLSWLYTSLHSLNYTHPVLLYQDISLILSLYPKSSLFLSQDNKIGLNSLFGICTFPIDYPLNPPSFTNPISSPVYDQWLNNFANQSSNDNIPPKENRLVLLFLSIHQFENQPPKLPEKPQIKDLESPINNNNNNNSSSTSSNNENAINLPTLPPNPIRIQLINSLQSKLDSSLNSILKSMQKSIIDSQIDLKNAFNLYDSTFNYTNDLNNSIEKVYHIVNEKTIDAINLTNSLNSYINSNYGNQSLLNFDDDINSKLMANTYLDSLNLLHLLFNNGKISLSLYIENTRNLSRKKALLLLSN
jgi:hypothetical protein